MEIKLYAWLLAFSLFLLVVHGEQKTRNSIRRNAEIHAKVERNSRRNQQEDTEDVWQNSGNDDVETDEDFASGGDEVDIDDTSDDIIEEEDIDEEDLEETGSAVPDDVPPTSHSPGLTPCLEMRNRKRPPNSSGYRPQCTESGAFEAKQCHEATRECWCVDSNGTMYGDMYRKPAEPICIPDSGRRPVVSHPPSRTDSDDFIIDTTVRPHGEMKTPRTGEDTKKDPDMEPLPPKAWFEYLLHQPLILAAVIGGSILVLAMLVLVLMFCIYRMRKKDEGSYSLDEPRQTFNYTRAKDQEFFA